MLDPTYTDKRVRGAMTGKTFKIVKDIRFVFSAFAAVICAWCVWAAEKIQADPNISPPTHFCGRLLDVCETDMRDAFQAGRDSIGWKDDQLVRVDYTFEDWLSKYDKGEK